MKNNFSNDWKYKFYCINKKNELVFGFDDNSEAKKYSKKHKYRTISFENLKKMRINPENIDLWSNTYFHPENENMCMKD